MTDPRRATWRAALLGGVLMAVAAPSQATNGCGTVRELGAQGYSAAEIANALNAPLSAVQGCFVPAAAVPSQRAPAGRVVSNAAGPAPLGAAGPAPFGAAGPAPLGAAGPAPIGAAGPAPFGAAGGTSKMTSGKTTAAKP